MNWAENALLFNWAVRFNNQVRDCLVSRQHGSLIDVYTFGEDARLRVPTPDHYLPLLYLSAQQAEDEVMSLPIDGVEHGSIGIGL
ncbi:MAG: hypothetical protein M3436_17895 [Pseudomonadota bacterium]|nr:hypothetical protein [Pseudomonadota bacterium]